MKIWNGGYCEAGVLNAGKATMKGKDLYIATWTITCTTIFQKEFVNVMVTNLEDSNCGLINFDP